MNTENTHLLKCLPGFVVLVLSLGAYAEPGRTMVHTGVTLNDVFVQVISSDPETGFAEVRFSGQDCQYCDDLYVIDHTTQMLTQDYQGSMDLSLLQEMVFVRASARVIRADKWVQEVRYVEIEE